MDEVQIKTSIKPLLARHFEQTVNVDNTSKKIDRINAQTAKIIGGVEEIKTKVNKNLMNMDVANDIAQKAKEEAEKFDAQANELASLVGGQNLMMIIILVVVGLLLAVAVFTNLYATINGPPGKSRKLMLETREKNFRVHEEFKVGIERREIKLQTQKDFLYSKGLFVII